MIVTEYDQVRLALVLSRAGTVSTTAESVKMSNADGRTRDGRNNRPRARPVGLAAFALLHYKFSVFNFQFSVKKRILTLSLSLY